MVDILVTAIWQLPATPCQLAADNFQLAAAAAGSCPLALVIPPKQTPWIFNELQANEHTAPPALNANCCLLAPPKPMEVHHRHT